MSPDLGVAGNLGRGGEDIERRRRGQVEQSENFVWDEEESEALRRDRKDSELALSVDSVRAYLKQIGPAKVAARPPNETEGGRAAKETRTARRHHRS